MISDYIGEHMGSKELDGLLKRNSASFWRWDRWDLDSCRWDTLRCHQTWLAGKSSN